jgi:hypothetical protein
MGRLSWRGVYEFGKCCFTATQAESGQNCSHQWFLNLDQLENEVRANLVENPIFVVYEKFPRHFFIAAKSKAHFCEAGEDEFTA